MAKTNQDRVELIYFTLQMQDKGEKTFKGKEKETEL